MRITAQNAIMIKPQLADFLSNLEVGDTVKGKLIEMFGKSISIKTASGQIFTAALMKEAQLQLGQMLELNISSITEQGIIAQLKTEEQKSQIKVENKLQQLLLQMDIKPDESNLQAAKLLLKYNMPVTKENIMNLAITQKSIESLAQGEAAKAVALLQSELSINNTELTKLVKTAVALEPQSQELIKALINNAQAAEEGVRQSAQSEIRQVAGNQLQTISQVSSQNPAEPQKTLEGNPKEIMQQLTVQLETEALKQDTPKLEKLIDTIEKVFETASRIKPEHTAYLLSKDKKITPAALKVLLDYTEGENKLSKHLEGLNALVEQLEKNQAEVKDIKQELKKLFLRPDELQDKEQAVENFKDIVKTASKLEKLITEQGLEGKVDVSSLQDIKNSLDFLRNINTNVNYLQLPLQINESNTTVEIYVYRGKKGNKSVNPENATILLALDLNRLGHIESLISVHKKNVDITFKVEKEDFKAEISKASKSLMTALEARGYKLNFFKVIDLQDRFKLIEPEELNEDISEQLHVDIRV